MKHKIIVPQSPQPKQAIPLVLPTTSKPASPCSCGCSEVLALLSDNTTHFAAWRCRRCDRFRGWIPKPKTMSAQQTENELIKTLLASEKLNDWEIWFCLDIKGLKKRHPNQRAKLQEIAKRLGVSANTLGGSHLFTEGGEA
jgi:hypothetical protein